MNATRPQIEQQPGSALAPANLPRGWVARGRLDRELRESGRFTLVTGPPGSGKSVLLSSWVLGATPGTVAWLPLDASDNDLGTFVRHLGEAAHDLDRPLHELLLHQMEPEGSPSVRSRKTRGRVGRESLALVVDDLHVITNREVRDLFEHLLRSLAPTARVIVASRRPPRLSNATIATVGLPDEIGGRELSFTPTEAQALFAAAGRGAVAYEPARALVECTEGWAVGLRLAMLMSAGVADLAAFAETFTGDVDLMADYFLREVVVNEPPDLLRFMVETSVLDEMTASSSAAVTEFRDAGAVLDQLARQNLFVTRLATVEPTYRYHRLFLDFLRNRLRRAIALPSPGPHSKAATWFADRGNPQAAIQHLVDDGAYDEALELGVSTLINVLDDTVPIEGIGPPISQLPSAYMLRDVSRQCVLAAGYLCDFRLAEATGCLRSIEDAIPTHPYAQLLRGDAELMWSIRDGLLSEPEGVLFHHHQAVGLLGHEESGASLPAESESLPVWLARFTRALQTKARALAAGASVSLDRPAGAISEPFDAARPSDDDRPYPGEPRGDARPAGSQILAVRAKLALSRGWLDDALRLATSALHDAEQKGRDGSVAAIDALLTLSSVSYERDDLAATGEALTRADALCVSESHAHWRVAIGCERVRMLVAQGGLSSALSNLRDLRESELRDSLPGHIGRRLDEVEVRCRLSIGDLGGSIRILNSGSGAIRTVEILARLDLCAGRPDRAAARLTATSDANVTTRADIERLLLLARSHRQLGDARRARLMLNRALDRGRAERFIRVFLDDTPELMGLLRTREGVGTDRYAAELLAHADRLGKPVNSSSIELLEHLTERERELLSFLSSNLSQHEIARRMYISLNTVKTHTKALYRKLGAVSRSEAVEMASFRGLI